MPAAGDQHCVDPSSIAAVVTRNPFEEPSRRVSEYTAAEIATLQSLLEKQLGPEYISKRPGASGQNVHYLAAEKCINLANEVFGFSGWSSSIQNIQIDFVDENPQTGKISLGLSVVVRVTLKNGSYHEDIGYGHIENCKGKAAAFEKAKKEGTTDALKRALRTFGNILGNCIYDKDYLTRVTKIKIPSSKWSADNLHRHPDYAPVQKESAQSDCSRISEDNDLPPRPNEPSTSTLDDTLALEADAEFGSDLFDETDLVATTIGNPDEISLVPESFQQKQPPQQAHVLPSENRPWSNVSHPSIRPAAPETPVKPGGVSRPGPVQRQQSPMPQNNTTPAARQNAPISSTSFAVQQGQTHSTMAQQPEQKPLPGPQIQKFDQESSSGITYGSTSFQSGASYNGAMAKVQPTSVQRQPSGSPPESIRSMNPAKGFYSARAVDMLRDNPSAAQSTVPQFDPYFDSPSIRKTAGVDHNKSLPITKPMLAATSNNRDFVNPSGDIHRRIGAPGGSGMSSPIGRGQSTSLYRPLTRPGMDLKIVGNSIGPNGGSSGQSINEKRPPLGDLTNTTHGAAIVSTTGRGNPKRPRALDGEDANVAVLQR